MPATCSGDHPIASAMSWLDTPASTNLLQKFSSVHAQVHNHFNQERHLVDRQTYKLRRSAALAEWQIVMA